ncbi:MAG TPA: phosphatidylinositol-specific phospholipase C1-like protein [Rhizomicrobium sp.]|nr:phosphatidylinositol-specific phospholipase C1-like protein [Rhizomicrobium sp.]
MKSILAVLAALSFPTPALAAPCDLAAPDAAHAGDGCARAWMDANLHLNDILVVGTHNSYKQAIDPKIMALIAGKSQALAASLDYSHMSLDKQLDDGARALELDVVYDPKGGLFAHPLGPAVVGETLPAGYSDAMMKPGFKVMHAQDFDFFSSCMTFVNCLGIIKAWSAAHPDHVPILITLNAKDDSPIPQGTQALKFDTAAFDALDAEIASVFSPGDLITPDQVQGSYPTLRDAVLEHGWPTLGASRGKFLFALDEDEPKISLYRGGRKSLEGRLMFVNAPEDSPAAAYLTLNEALTDTAHITADVKAGFLVRTRADADTAEARKNDTARRDAALASGAQYVSTDYMETDTRFGPYQARLRDGAIALCNPEREPERCAGLSVEP